MSENVTDFEQKINNINVCLKTGNVAAEDADCIVVPEFREGASSGGIGYAIETAGMGAGLEAYEKVAQEGFLKDGDAVITESGKPDVKLAHVVTVSAREDSQLEVVNRSILKTLETANEIGIKRIALPEIGTGIVGSLTQEQSAKAIFNAIYEFSKNNPTSSVEEVSFVVYGRSTEPAKRVLTDKSYVDIMADEKGNKPLDFEEFVEGLANNGVRKKAKSPTKEEILNDKATYEYGRNLVTKLFWAETREAVDAYIEAGIDINQKSRAENRTALDYCIGRIVRGINTYEDSDNKGAVLQMALKGGTCSEESLEQLKAKDPELHFRVVGIMKMRERLQDLGAEIVTGTQYPRSGHADEDKGDKIAEALGRLAGKMASKGDKPRPSSGRDIYRYPPDYDFEREERMKKIIEKERKKKMANMTFEEPNRQENLTLAMGGEHEPLHEPDELTTAPTHETQHRKNIMEELKEKRERLDLLKGAFTINRKQGSTIISIDELCKQMVKAAEISPVKADDNGNIFVIRKGADLSEALFAWKEQALKPRFHKQIEEKPEKYPAVYADRLNRYGDRTKIDCASDSYFEAAMVELLVTEYPEYTDKITTLQLLNALSKTEYNTDNSEKLLEELNKSAEKFAKGAETFPPTLENIVTFNAQREHLDFLLSGKFGYDAHKGGTLRADFDKRVDEVELKMLKELKAEDLEVVSDNVIFKGRKIANKHKDADDFGKLFTDEVMKRLAKGKVFDPRDPKE